MLSEITKTQTFDATSSVMDGEDRLLVSHMTGSLSSEGNYSFNYVISDQNLYNAHKDEVETDFENFKAQMMEG